MTGVRVRALLFASLQEAAGARVVEEDLDPGATVADLSEKLSDRFPALRERLPRVRVAVNDAITNPAHALAGGDEVAYLPAVSGGAQTGYVAITEEPISVDQVMASVRRDDCGALVVFLGTVRDNFQGRRVVGMEYEGHGTLAEHSLAELAETARRQFEVAAVSIVHRLGNLTLGEISVVVAVSSPHRASAFEAGRFAIDEIKKIVPIWKREFLEDGAVWIEGDERIESAAVTKGQQH